jgi:hypothetical protein
MNNSSIVVPARWSSRSDENVEDDLFFIQDNTRSNEGWWVLMKEECGSMILFTNLSKETAENIKARLESAVYQYFEV